MKKIIHGLKILRGNLALAIGLFLLVLSAYPVFLMARETKAMSDADSRFHTAAYGWQSTGDAALHFKIKCLGNRTFVNFQEQRVILSDKFKMSKATQDSTTFDKTKLGIVNININSRDYTHPSQVEIRTEVDDANRYWMQVMVAEITDKVENKTRLAILQSFPRFDFNNFANYDLNNMKCRILFVDANGKVEEDVFRFGDRANPIYRALLAYYVAPEPLGLTSQVFQYWPTIFYPLLYPFVTGILGLILTVKGVRARRNRQP